MGQIWCKLGQLSRKKTNEALLGAPHHGPRELGLAGSQMGLERWEACRRCGSPHRRATHQQASGELYCSSLKKNASGGEVQREPRRGKDLEEEALGRSEWHRGWSWWCSTMQGPRWCCLEDTRRSRTTTVAPWSLGELRLARDLAKEQRRGRGTAGMTLGGGHGWCCGSYSCRIRR